MTNILFVIGGIYRNLFKCSYLRNKKLFLNFLFHFWNFHQILKILKKKDDRITYVFPKLETAKQVVSYFSKKPRFRKPFDSKHAKAS